MEHHFDSEGGRVGWIKEEKGMKKKGITMRTRQ